MKRATMKLTLILSLAAAAVLALGATAASAHGGKGGGAHGVSTTKLVNAAAKQLNVTPAKLKAAMVAAAVTQINEAVADEDIDADEAADLKEEVQDNLKTAYCPQPGEHGREGARDHDGPAQHRVPGGPQGV